MERDDLQLHFDFVNSAQISMEICETSAEGEAVKKPVPLKYFVLKVPANFVTRSGNQRGKIGDVVIIGKDHAWPVSREYFEENYQVIESAND